jgi:hypothetical protein
MVVLSAAALRNPFLLLGVHRNPFLLLGVHRNPFLLLEVLQIQSLQMEVVAKLLTSCTFRWSINFSLIRNL